MFAVLRVFIIMVALNLASLNVCGMRDVSKRGWMFDWVRQHNIDIFLCQETHCRSLVEGRVWEKEWGGRAFWSFGFGHSLGVGILVRRNLNLENVSFYSHPSGRLVLINFLFEGCEFRVINVYAPNRGKERKRFIETLDRHLMGRRCHIVAGDFTFVHNLNLDKRGGDPSSGDIGSIEMSTVCKDFMLVDVFRKKCPTIKEYTWFSPSKDIACRLDRVYIDEGFFENVSDCSFVPCPKSDHSLVMIQVQGNIFSAGPGIWKCNSRVLETPDFGQDFSRIWETLSEVTVKSAT